MNIRRIFRLAFETFCWLIAFNGVAHAGFLVAALGTAFSSILGGSTILAGIVKLAIGVALKVGIALIQRASQPKQRDPGIKSDVTVGGDNPLSFIVGTYATAGQLEYINTYGSEGDTPNVFLTMVISLGDLPVAGFTDTVWIDTQKCTLAAGAGGDAGRAVVEKRRNGYERCWVKYYDGTQTGVDPYLHAKFGGDPNRPYTSDMVGRGIPYAVVTVFYDRKVWNGIPKFRFEIANGVKLYNPAKDTTNGGSGSHRWTDPTTWEGTTNNAVIIYNLVRGIYYGDTWVYGGQNLPQQLLPASSWIAAINECDVAISLVAGGTEKQYRAGYEILVSDEPLSTIEGFLDGCSGRMMEIGGFYKIKVGAPSASVYSFTDADIVATEDLNFDPFPGLEQTYNGAHASYPEPAEAWAVKDAPPYLVSALQTEDEGRQLIASLTYSTTPFPTQVQRLMKAAVEANRKFRRHVVPLPPEAWLLEPGDTIDWTSTREGYTNKQFVISQMTGRVGLIQFVSIQEVDASDYNWTPATDEKPYSVGYTGSVLPPIQAMTGWQAFPAQLKDNAGNDRAPTILVSFPGTLEDVQFVRVQIKLTASPDTDLVFDGSLPYGDPTTNADPLQVILNAVLLPNTNYKVRGIFVPFSGRDTDWGAWVDVLTDDVLPSDLRYDLEHAQSDLIAFYTGISQQLQDVRSKLQQLALANAQTGGRITKDNSVAVIDRNAKALAITELNASIDTINGELVAQASAITDVEASVGLVSADGLFQITAVAGSGDVVSQMVFQVRASISDVWVDAGFIMEAGFTGGNPLLPFSNVVIRTDKFSITDGTNTGTPLTFESGTMKLLVANIGTVIAGLVKSPDDLFQMTVADGKIEWFDP